MHIIEHIGAADRGASRPVVLTGDRTTGPLHLGHYAGSLRRRVEIQHDHDQTLLLADAQALTDNGHDPARVRDNVLEVAADYIAAGIDPEITTICVQSRLHALDRLTTLYMNLVTVARLERNPTVKAEIQLKGMERDIPAGFLCYPVAQAADITAFRATLVPCGDDQLPMIEQSNEIVGRINRLAGREVLPRARAMLSRVTRLPGVDGRAKASKSLGNAIALGAPREAVEAAVRAMYTDPGHVRASDPGRVEGNVVFAYLDAFDPDADELDDLKARYRRGGLGDMVLKRRLVGVLEDLLEPIRERRSRIAADRGYLMDVLREGTRRARAVTDGVADEIGEAIGLFSL
jgi:tryptophanyl-tRNA synthetase